jgi:EcoRII C terminal
MAKVIKSNPPKSSTKNLLFAATSDGIPSAADLMAEALEVTLRNVADDRKYIQKNFSALIFGLQSEVYRVYLRHESQAGGTVLREAFTKMAGATATVEILLNTIEKNFSVLDKYFLSLSQSRKARAGTSFQLIMTALLKRLNYTFEEQPILPDSKPDYVLPSKTWYSKNASDCIILTLKRTLRERWRQVPTEGNTGSTYFLATIDAKVPPEELAKMKTLNVKLVVPLELKKMNYASAMNVISFEDFFEDYLDPAVIRWKKAGAI